MNTVDYGNDRWKIVYGEYSKMQKKAVELAHSTVSKYVPYCVVTEKKPSSLDDNLILIGTRNDNKYIHDLVSDEDILENGFYFKVIDSPYTKNKQVIIITGSDDVSVFYCSTFFADDYIAFSKPREDHQPYFRKLFKEKMPFYEISSVPSIKTRGLWTWGHTIYNYRKYIDNMARLKLNQLIIWNDHLPVNAKEIVEYAHENSIQIVWGYSWGWGEKFNVTDPLSLLKWSDHAIKAYEKDYADLGADGIYIQSFTETRDEMKDGQLISQAVTIWINTISGRILNKYPDLKIHFGLHATSVRNQLEFIKMIDDRVSIIWEDCGSFPYQYLPSKTEDFEDTLEFTNRIVNLRANSPFGVVLKGQICLDWSNFEHQAGPYVLGSSFQSKTNGLFSEKKEIWHYIQSYWLKNGHLCQKIINELNNQTDGNAMISALVEDGLFEDYIWLPVALYSQMLWDAKKPFSEILCIVSQRDNVVFA
ncbi:MAG: hypothetical protein WC332_03075 [Clostridia bacterium]|jgi:hypothetical protein